MEVFGTSFLPNILYFQCLASASDPVVDLGEHFIKQTYRNRSVILGSNGPLQLTVPLRKNDSKVVIDQEISYAEDWQTKALRAIRSSYTNSPYYEHYQEEFEHLLMKKDALLYLYNKGLFNWLLKELDLNMQIRYSDSYIIQNINNDLRNVDFNEVTTPSTIIKYKQVFSYKTDFVAGLSVIDLLFNKGPESLIYIK